MTSRDEKRSDLLASVNETRPEGFAAVDGVDGAGRCFEGRFALRSSCAASSVVPASLAGGRYILFHVLVYFWKISTLMFYSEKNHEMGPCDWMVINIAYAAAT